MAQRSSDRGGRGRNGTGDNAKILWPGQGASTAKNLDLDIWCETARSKGQERERRSLSSFAQAVATRPSSFLSCKRLPSDALERAVSVDAFPTSSRTAMEKYSTIFAAVKVRDFEVMVDAASEDGVI